MSKLQVDSLKIVLTDEAGLKTEIELSNRIHWTVTGILYPRHVRIMGKLEQIVKEANE